MADEEQIILPERFKRLSSIVTDGTQWIDTGYVPTNTTGFWVDSIDNGNASNYVMGMNETTNWNSNKRMYIRTSTNLLYGWMTSVTSQNINGHNKRVLASLNYLNSRKASWTLDGNTYDSSTLSDLTFVPSKTLFLGAVNFGGTINGTTSKLQIFEAKISEGTEVVRHFVPAFDTLRSEACMYEVKEGKAYYNKGTGALEVKFNLEDEQLGILHKLPEGFTKIKYLISNGYQYIDTNYVPTNETGYYVEGQGYTTSETYYFGLRENTSTNSRIYACATNYVNWGWMTYGTLTNAAANLRQETKFYHNFLNSRVSKATINETDFTYNLPELDFNPSISIYLFGYNQAGVQNTTYGLKGRIDTFLISEGDQIVRQFVPCLDENGIPCMYELYTGTVHYNRGSGQFSYPREYINDPINLPAGYTKCVYLQSDGTQWIDTEVIPDADTGVYLKAQHLNYGDFTPFGSWENSSAYFYPPRFNTSSKAGIYSFGTTYQHAFYYDKGDDLIFTSTMNLYNDRTVNFWSDDTNWFGIIPVNFTMTFTRSLWLFSYNMDNATINATYGKFGGRIFRAKITHGDYLVHDFVPCLDTDNRPCMYDLVTQEPYYNQSSGVEFTYCVEHQLPSDFIKLKYLESTGTQIIKTGYVPTDTTGIYVDAYHVKQEGNTVGSVIGLRNTNGNTYFYVGRVQRDTNGAGFGWGAFTTPGGNGNVRYEASLNFLNDRQSIITAPAFAQRINALGTLAFTPTKDLYMFGMNNYDGAVTLYSTYRIYRAKISEENEITRDFVPAYDQRTHRPCMYDLINNVPYYNDGTGEFTYNKDFEGDYIGCGILGGIGNRLGYYQSSSSDNEITSIILEKGQYIRVPYEYIFYVERLSKVRIKFSVVSIDYEDGQWFNLFSTATTGTIDHKINGGENGIGIHDDPNLIQVHGVYTHTYDGIWGHSCRTFNMKNEEIHDIEAYVGDDEGNLRGDELKINYNGELVSPISNNELEDMEMTWDDGEYFIGGPGISLVVYGAQIYDYDENLVADVVPHKNENGEIGLFCNINNTFLPIQS